MLREYTKTTKKNRSVRIYSIISHARTRYRLLFNINQSDSKSVAIEFILSL